MKIVYVGRVSLSFLAERFQFNRAFPVVRWGFGIGSQVIAGLIARGQDVRVVTWHCGIDDVQVYRGQGLKCGNVVVYLVPGRATKWQFLTLYWREVRMMRKLIREIRPDVVFAQWTYENAYVGLTSGVPTLCVGHDSPWTVLKTFRNVYALFHAFYCQLFVIPRLKHLSVVSPHIEEDFRKQCGYKGKVVLIPNGIQVKGSLLSGSKLQVSRERIGEKIVRKEAKTIVCVSQAGRLKNTKVLSEAFELLKERHSDWRLLMYGQGLPNGLASREELDRVLFEEADVFCSPSLEESFGMVFVEAMILGVPCVGGAKSGAVPWVMGDGGVTCDVTSPKQLAESLENVMLDWKLRQKLSVAGIKRVKEMFDIEKVVDAYEKELERVARGRARGV